MAEEATVVESPLAACPYCVTALRVTKLEHSWLECLSCGMVFHPGLKIQNFRPKPQPVLAQRIEQYGPYRPQDLPAAHPGDWMVTHAHGEGRCCHLVSAEAFASQYEPDDNATELEILQRQVEALRINHEEHARLNQEFARLGVFFREHYKQEIEAGEHRGLSCAEAVIRYLTRERDQWARERKLVPTSAEEARRLWNRECGRREDG